MGKKTKRTKKKDEANFKKGLTQVLQLPQDVTLGAAIVTITGKNEVIIENYRGIIEYNTDYIKLSTKSGIIELTGKKFLIEYFTNDEMKITGKISEVKYL